MPQNLSQQSFDAACRVIPGGVNSPVRAFASVGGTPRFIERAEGAHVYDRDGNAYIDYVGSYGPMILGHANTRVIEAIREQTAKGLSYGAPTDLETQLAELICAMVDSIESVRMVNSGTEAAMTALRLARGYTGRNKVLKFAGCYHGHVDALLVEAGSGALTLGIPGSPGIPAGVTQDTLVATYNDLDSAAQAFAQYGDEIACIIVEPVAGNMNCIPPVDGFLEGLRGLCDDHGALLIIDEVMTGFRVAPGGAQEKYGIRPDLSLLGKIVGGGMPVAAVGGRREIMATLAPVGPVYQAGTLSGHPLAMVAGIATLTQLQQGDFYRHIDAHLAQLLTGLEQRAQKHGIALKTQSAGGMFGLFFTDQSAPITRFDQVQACDTARFTRFFHAMLEAGVYLAPSPFEAGFISAAHTEPVIAQTLAAAETVFARIG